MKKTLFAIAGISLSLFGAGCGSGGTSTATVTQVADVCAFFTQAELDSKLGKGFSGTKIAPGDINSGVFATCLYEHATRPESFSIHIYKTTNAKSDYEDFKRQEMAIENRHVQDASGVGTASFWSYAVSDIAYMTIKNDKTVPGPRYSADYYAYQGGTLVWIEAHSDTIANDKNFPGIAAYFAQRALEKS
jgi:hypothetical protein